MKHIYILVWRYLDGSDSGIFRAYRNESDAISDMKALADVCSERQWRVESVKFEDF